jgi:hypothetical protein
MTHCYDEGVLRAELDRELLPAARALLAAHLEGCADCRERMRALRARVRQIEPLLAAPQPAPDPQAALARLRTRTLAEPASAGSAPSVPQRRNPMNSNRFGSRRSLFAGLAAVLVLLSLLALPPVRAAAGSLLQIFRVQKVVFVPVSRERMQQLENLKFDESTLFVGKPRLQSGKEQPREVRSSVEASALVGFNVESPAGLPSAPSSTRVAVQGRQTVEAQINVQAARELLRLMQVDDVNLPDALGSAPIRAQVEPTVMSSYQGSGYEVTLIQGRSPRVSLPPGVEMAQLGKAALRLLGTEPGQAEAMSRDIDWSSTLLFPIPADVSELRPVDIHGGKGMLATSGGQSRESVIYWQKGDRFYVLHVNSRNSSQVIALAESVR